MAVDTPSKRLSIIHLGNPWRQTVPLPDGTINAGDRLHTAYLYSGIAEQPSPTVAVDRGWTIKFRSRTWHISERGRTWHIKQSNR